MKFEVSRYLDRRYKSKSGTYPVSIRIYCNRKNEDVKTGVALTVEEFNQLHLPKIKPALKNALSKIAEVEALVNAYLDSCNLYNIINLRSYVSAVNPQSPTKEIDVPAKSADVFKWFEQKIEQCKKNKQLGSAESYQSTKNVYQQLFRTQVIEFSFFTSQKLKEMETTLIDKREVAISTVGKHARNLRTIFRMALNDNVITNEHYPFGRYKYIIPQVTKAKKSLSRSTLKALIEYVPQTYYEKRALGFFVFSYYANGMNLKDVALLKYKDWQDDIIYYYRKKTKNTNCNLKLIRVFVTDEMKQVIAEFGNADKGKEEYIFPIINAGMDALEIKNKVKTRNKSINNTLKIIVRKAGLSGSITLGMSRHSFANALKQEGVAISFIQEALGHGSPSVTEHYLNSFEDVISKEHIQKLRNYYK